MEQALPAKADLSPWGGVKQGHRAAVGRPWEAARAALQGSQRRGPAQSRGRWPQGTSHRKWHRKSSAVFPAKADPTCAAREAHAAPHSNPTVTRPAPPLLLQLPHKPGRPQGPEGWRGCSVGHGPGQLRGGQAPRPGRRHVCAGGSLRGTGLECKVCEAQWKPSAMSLGLRLAPTRAASCSLPQGASVSRACREAGEADRRAESVRQAKAPGAGSVGTSGLPERPEAPEGVCEACCLLMRHEHVGR